MSKLKFVGHASVLAILAFTTVPATYTGRIGTFSFDLVYSECCGASAALWIALSFVFVALGLLGFAARHGNQKGVFPLSPKPCRRLL
jgi:hypothetical protein